MIDSFIAKWKDSGGNERANTQLFIADLCAVLGVSAPNPASSQTINNDYVFERFITKVELDGSVSNGWIDCYKRDCFVLESKQGSDADRLAFDSGQSDSRRDLFGQTAGERFKRGMAKRGTPQWTSAMQRAGGQAEGYAKALPADHGWPPFLIVCDVGYCFDIYSSFQRDGKGYSPYPNRRQFRITLEDLRDQAVRDRLTAIWQDPIALDPSKEAARVTSAIANHLAIIARELERREGNAEKVSRFLMRLLFTMFAQHTGLLPRGSFSELLQKHRDQPVNLAQILTELWCKMDTGGFSSTLGDHGENILRFNGYLFKDTDALVLSRDEIDILAAAAKADWKQVEPAIFGTLLERALNEKERAKLGAHYTPREYVERLVSPTIMEPLRQDWLGARTAATKLADEGDVAKARQVVEEFHLKLTGTKVLDPACGTANFLYVALARMKELEGEVLELLDALGDQSYISELSSHTITPENFLGIEVNPRAAEIAQLVLWIGYLQWHFRVNGDGRLPVPPILRDVRTIENRDALLIWDRLDPVLDSSGQPITRWDGETTKDTVAGKKRIPDTSARVPVWKYVNPRPAKWPKADFIIGNPPFIGVRKLNERLGDGYVSALRQAYQDVARTADFVMYWWHCAAEAIRGNQSRRFGLITTNSIVQDYSRVVVEKHLDARRNPLKLVYAVTNHPWIESKDGAAVDVAMTVGAPFNEATRSRVGRIRRETKSFSVDEITVSEVRATLRDIPDVFAAKALRANAGMCFQGVVPAGEGFKLREATSPVGESTVIKPYMIGDDLTNRLSNEYIIDFFGLSESEAEDVNPEAFAKVLSDVMPERDENPREVYRRKWWIFAEPRPNLRNAIKGLKRYIATPYTAVHRPFVFLPSDVVPDAMIYVIPSSDAYLLAVLSSRVHTVWCRYCGGTLQDRPRYNSKRTFFPFPFPEVDDENLRHRLRQDGEKLDRIRKRVIRANPDLTITKLYNTLAKIRLAETSNIKLSDADRDVARRGCVSLIQRFHDRIDASVFKAYGWREEMSDTEVLERVISLNRVRASEEASGRILSLREDVQNQLSEDDFDQGELNVEQKDDVVRELIPWPSSLAAQVVAVMGVIQTSPYPMTPTEIAASFLHKRSRGVVPVLDALAEMGSLRKLGDGRFAA